MRFNFKVDWFILIPILIIASLSLAVLSSIAPEELTSQVIFLVTGLSLYFLVSQVNVKFFKAFWPIFYFMAVVLLLVTLFWGETIRGAVRWLNLGVFSFQPSEAAKPLLILSFAGLAAAKDLTKFKNFLFLFLLSLPPFFLVFFQPDLGSAMVIFLIYFLIAFGAKGRILYFLFVFLAIAASFPFARHFLKDYQKRRIAVFFNPHLDPLGASYHLIQAKIAVGSGKFLGKGLGVGTQSQLRFLPEKETDFIFASLAEELGFLGSFLLLAAFFTLLWRILKIAQNEEGFVKFVCLGTFAMIFAQVFVNIGMNLGLVPVTGIVLPLVSSGGSSFITTMISLGIVHAVSIRLRGKRAVEIR